jgi:beta-galactosidase
LLIRLKAISPLIPLGRANTVRQYFTVGYSEQVKIAFKPFFEDNIDAAIINIGHSRLDYKLIVVPANYVMDAASADAIRSM